MSMRQAGLWLGVVLWATCLACPPGQGDGEGSPGADATKLERRPERPSPSSLGLSARCPGSPGCATSQGALKAGVAAVAISPKRYERARFAYFKENKSCPTPTPKAPFGLLRCGRLRDDVFGKRGDCGLDGLCPGDRIQTQRSCQREPCPAGMQCGPNKRCILQYQKPDADGSERDGLPDWFIDCGRDGLCPCTAPDGQPAYFGTQKSCLIGHKANPDYTGPDADGSEGNGSFEGIWMGGFVSNHPLQGKHDDIWARALVLETGETTVALVSVDLVGLFYTGVEQVRKLLSEKLPAGAIDYLVISATHTHGGPDSMGQWGATPNGLPGKTGVDALWYSQALAQIADAILQAHQKRRPATLYAATTKTGDQGFVKDSRAPYIIDDALQVLQLRDAKSDATLATVVNWANHPEVLEIPNNYLTSDFAHYLRQALEQGLPAGKSRPALAAQGGVALYFQGAVGGLMTPLSVPIPDGDGELRSSHDWKTAAALGHQLAHSTAKALQSAQKIATPTLSLWAKNLALPVDNRLLQIGYQLGLFDRKPPSFDPDLPIGPQNVLALRSEVALLQLGEISFLTVPGEIDPSLVVGGFDGSYSHGKALVPKDHPHPPELARAPKGPYLKDRLPGKFKLILGLGNDAIGYIVPSWNFKLHPKRPYFEKAPGDHYEETNSLGPQTAPLLLDAYGALFGHLPKP